MSFTTKVLPVNREAISFVNDMPIFSDVVTKENLELAAKEIQKAGTVVAFPTETVYGLGGSALNDESVKSIYKAKNRPADNPLIVHVSSVDQLQRLILTKLHTIPPVYEKLIERFWPGPLTILVPVEEGSPVLKLVTADQNTVGIRMPDHPVARALIALSDTPIAAPSANASTRPSPTLANHVLHDLNTKIPYILDGGLCSVGLESSVVDGLVSPPMLLRPGGLTAEDIREYGGGEWENLVLAKRTAGDSETVRTPGMKYRHYSPTAKVVLFVDCGDGKSAVSKYMEGKDIEHAKVAVLRAGKFVSSGELGLLGAIERRMGNNSGEVAHSLFKLLREVDEMDVSLIIVEGVEESGDGLAVMNRLSKAAFETITGEE
ncbi:CIC11C00000005258 [Sungouiella intermedia]|uniref:Threonylcarbamoyl-AMP synthase n=1 Tax=Sungouiella intermedia TaxID=45354 RepID=A0A1L0BII6_9ASCO|nr:CIC11C00000005258 [[Candida] intermedia]